MNIDLTPEEQKLVEYSKEAIIKYNKIRHVNGGVDTLYSFLLTNSGKIHDGACFETKLGHASICAERHAVANMILQESYKAKIKSIVVADPVPEIQQNSTPPCGTCRHVIWTHETPKTSVILIQYIMGKQGWIFPKIEKYFMKELYPHPYDPKEGLWDNFEPK